MRGLPLAIFGLLAAYQDNVPSGELHTAPRFDDPPLPPRHRSLVIDDDLNYGRSTRAPAMPVEWRVPCRRPDCAAPIGQGCKKSTLGRKFVHGCRAEDAKALENGVTS